MRCKATPQLLVSVFFGGSLALNFSPNSEQHNRPTQRLHGQKRNSHHVTQDTQMSGSGITVLSLLFLLVSPATSFLYQPGSPSGNIVSEGKPGMGEIWDPSVTWWRGKWYAHAMYQKPGLRTNVYESGWLATSEDGCHWEDGGPVAPEHPGDMWWKGFVRQIRGDAANTTDDSQP